MKRVRELLLASWGVAACLALGSLAGADTEDATSGLIDLQSLIDAAAPGATLTLAPGIYAAPILIDHALTIASDGDGEVVLQGPGSGDVVQITASDVTLSGLVIRGTGKSLDRENAGIVGTAAHITVEDCRLEDVLFGIYLKESPFAIIRRTQVGAKPLAQPRRGDAIRLWRCPNSLIEDNVVRGSRDVIVWFSDNVMLRRNTVTEGRYGMHFMYSSQNTLEDNVLTDNSVGAFLMYSKNLTLRRNVFARNRGPSGFGVGLKDMDGLTAEDNLFVGNRVGLHLDNSPSDINVRHMLRRNVFGFNDIGIAFLPMVKGNDFTENTFLENIEQVSILGSGTLKGNRFSIDGRGNYWSDYQGFDIDGDGIGESAYHANAFFENLIDREPRLRLFLYSPAHRAVEMAARAFPIVTPRPKIVDPSPLLAPVIPEIDIVIPTGEAGLLAGLLLLGIGLACLMPALGGRGLREVRAVQPTLQPESGAKVHS